MANITLNVRGFAGGTGSYNPVPASFGPVTGSLALRLVGQSDYTGLPFDYPFLNLDNLTINWQNGTLTAAAEPTGVQPPFYFSQTLNNGIIQGVPVGLEPIGFPQVALPGASITGTLYTTVTTTDGTFQIIAGTGE